MLQSKAKREKRNNWFFPLAKISENACAAEKSNWNSCRKLRAAVMFRWFNLLGKLHKVPQELAHRAVGQIAAKESTWVRPSRGHPNVCHQAIGYREDLQWSIVEAFFSLLEQKVSEHTRNQNGRCRWEMVRDDLENLCRYKYHQNLKIIVPKSFWISPQIFRHNKFTPTSEIKAHFLFKACKTFPNSISLHFWK